MYKIGEFSKIVDIPVRTLRYYAEYGVLIPNEVDTFSGYKYYDDEKYEFEIFDGSIFIDKLDDNFKNILNNNMYEERNTEYKNTEGSFYFYAIDSYSETIFDEYFN